MVVGLASTNLSSNLINSIVATIGRVIAGQTLTMLVATATITFPSWGRP